MVRLIYTGLCLSPLLLAACGTGPSTPPLIGRWGNSMVEVVAQAPVVELHLACSTKARFLARCVLMRRGAFSCVTPDFPGVVCLA